MKRCYNSKVKMCYNSKVKMCCSSIMFGIDVNTIYIPSLVPPKLLELVWKKCERKLVYLNSGVIKFWVSKIATSKSKPMLKFGK